MNTRGDRDGAVMRALPSHRCGSGSILELDAICGLSLLLVLFSALRGFSPGSPVFPSPQKPAFLNSYSVAFILSNIPHEFYIAYMEFYLSNHQMQNLIMILPLPPPAR